MAARRQRHDCLRRLWRVFETTRPPSAFLEDTPAPASSPSESELRDALNAVVLDTLPIVAIGLAALFGIFAVSHAVVLQTSIALTMTVTASLTSIACAGLWYALRRFPVSPSWAHPIGACIAAMVLANVLLHQYLISQPQETTNLMLLILGAGFVALSFRWLTLVIVVTLAGWAAVAGASMRVPTWRHFGFALVASTVLSLVIHAARVRTLGRLQRLRLVDERRRAELSTALRESEQARHSLELSARAMELMVQAAHQSEERFRRFTDLEGITIHEQCRIRDANPALGRMLGYELTQIVGMDLRQFFTPESREWVAQKLNTDCDMPYEATVLRKDGPPIPVECVSKTVPYQDRTARVVALRDISERKRAEQAVRRSEALYRTLADNVPGLVFTNTADGGCDYCNRRWHEFTGLSEAETLGFGWLTALHVEDRKRLTSEVIDSFLRGESSQCEIRLRGRDGRYRWFLGRSSPVRDARGEIIKWVGTCMNIDDRKRMEHTLREADRRKDEFLAILGHELRNPLASVRNAEHFLRVTGACHGRADEARDIIGRQITHMTRLIDDLLDLSRVSSGKIALHREPVFVVELVCKTVEDHHSALEGRGLTVITDFTDAQLCVIGDSVRLSQVVGNVLQNAAKFTDPGGIVRVTVRRSSEGTTAEIKISDTGIGMDRELLGRLFDPFAQGDYRRTRHQDGLGLGLALAKRLVEAHGGEVFASSAGPGRGSEFTVRLPLEARAIERTETRRTNARLTGPCRILLIEDDVDVATSMQFLLESAGHEVAIATDGAGGLDMARERRPDVVMCDIGLPSGFDGYAVARAIRRDDTLRDVYLIAISGYGQDADRRRAHAAGFDTHLTKPVDFTELEHALASRARLNAGDMPNEASEIVRH